MTVKTLKSVGVIDDLLNTDTTQVDTVTYNALTGKVWLPYMSSDPALYAGTIVDSGLVTIISNSTVVHLSNEGEPGVYPGVNPNGTDVYLYTGALVAGGVEITYVTGVNWAESTTATITNTPIRLVNDGDVKFTRVDDVPASPVQGNIYLKRIGAAAASFHVTTRDGGSTNTLITDTALTNKLNLASGLLSDIRIAADTATRDTLTFPVNKLVMVLDATGDTSVTTGAAMYLWKVADSTYTKVYEAEGIDAVTDWADFDAVTMPTSTITDIDNFVTVISHDHINAGILDGVAESANGNLVANSVELTEGVQLENDSW